MYGDDVDFLKCVFDAYIGEFNVDSMLSIEGVCVDALAQVMMTISGSTFHPLLTILSINGLYFFYFSTRCFIWYSINTLCEFVNHIVRFSLCYVGSGN